MVVFDLQLPIEPAGKIAQRLHDSPFTALGRCLPSRAVARHVDGHAVFVVVAPTVGHIGTELEEIPPLRVLKAVGDAVQSMILWGIGADFAGGTAGMTDRGLKAGVMRSRR